ncbi:MAG: peptidoglycan-binding protein [Pseudomonadota bacterium]|nr:peptidoglycan-binding protein [Pseudomonadota bacterium]
MEKIRTGTVLVLAGALALAGCGSDTESRAATGGATGVVAGALVGGPVGAVVGGGIGATGGAVMDEGVDTKADRVINGDQTSERQYSTSSRTGYRDDYTSSARSPEDKGIDWKSRGTASEERMNRSQIMEVQRALKSAGYDPGPVDGVLGPRTRSALQEFQRNGGLDVTGRLDQETLSALDVDVDAQNDW